MAQKERFFGIVCFLFLLLFFLALASPQADAASPRAGGILRFGLSSEPPNLDPHKSTGGAAQCVKDVIYGGLVKYWKDHSIVPDLAQSWNISADGRQYTFHLQKDVKWHNGEKFTARDVKFTMERIVDPGSGATIRGEIAAVVEKVEILDEYTLRFVLKRPSVSFLPVLASVFCQIVSKSYVEGGGNLNKHPMGTGAFKFAEWTPTVSLKVTKNPAYFKKGLPYLEGIQYIFYPDETSRVTALRTGAVDMIDYLPWKQMAAVERDAKLRLLGDKEMLFMFALINFRKPPLDNPKVREAIARAVNREAMLKNVFFGRGQVIGGTFLPPSWEGFSPEINKTYTHSPEGAKKLLAEAGFPKGFDLTILSTFQYGMHKGSAEILQANLKELGLNAKLELLDWATVFKRRDAGQFEILVWGSMPYYKDSAFLTSYVETDSAYAKVMGFSDEIIDRSLAELDRTFDLKKRREILYQAQRRILELNPFLFFVWREQAEGTQAYVKGYNHIPGIFDSYNTLEATWLDK
jgi:peptide/nickel transport system substrate-binding protein/glutathione transport system substrate-binding protein